jgi:hypothetical protein
VDAEQRRVHRFPVDLPARYRSEGSSGDGRAANISQDGVRLVGAGLHADPGPVLLEIDLPDSEAPLAVGGVICWLSDGPMRSLGIRFTRIETTARRRLANFVIRRACSD